MYVYLRFLVDYDLVLWKTTGIFSTSFSFNPDKVTHLRNTTIISVASNRMCILAKLVVWNLTHTWHAFYETLPIIKYHLNPSNYSEVINWKPTLNITTTNVFSTKLVDFDLDLEARRPEPVFCTLSWYSKHIC